MAGISFDRAAGYYDATRGLPAAVREMLGDVLASALVGHEPCLEVGVGTGRIALPVHERGCALVGVDLSTPMLRRLVANAGGHRPFPLVVGDAASLPVASASFGSVTASHVLHLVSDWERTVDEMVRVLRPRGLLLVDFAGDAPTPWWDQTEAILQRHGVRRIRPGVTDPDDVTAYLGGRVTVHRLAPVRLGVHRSLAQDLDEWEHQIHAWLWPYPPDQVGAAVADIRSWAAGDGWPLNERFEIERTIQWWAFELA